VNSAPGAARPARRTIRPPSGWAALDLREVVRYRDLLVTLAARDVRLRYRQTVLGILWVVLQPLIAAGIFSFVFGRIAGLGSGVAVPYFVWAFAGQVAWAAFSGTLTKASGSLLQNASLVSKVFFPRLVLPLSTVASTFVDFAVGCVVLAGLMLVNRVWPGWQIVTLPVWFALITLLGLGAGLIASALMVAYRDVQYILPVAVNFLLFASPIGWGLAELAGRCPPNLRVLYLLLNPLAPLLEAFRWSLFGAGRGGAAVPWGWVAYAAAVTLGLVVLGASVFRNRERGFADVI
jgi:lipopolysaccharide transport system permease protein